MRITASVQYFLRPHQLKYLHKNFDVHYSPVIRKNAIDAVKVGQTLVVYMRQALCPRHTKLVLITFFRTGSNCVRT